MTKSKGKIIKDPVERFWANVNTLPTPSGCMEWSGRKNYKGYGVMKVNSKSVQAHRFSWELHNLSEIPNGLCVCHHCDNRVCINPSHLFLGTIQENNADRDKKGRKALGEVNGKSKLTKEDVIQIRSMLEQGDSSSQIARKFGRSHGAITGIKLGRSWKWLH